MKANTIKILRLLSALSFIAALTCWSLIGFKGYSKWFFIYLTSGILLFAIEKIIIHCKKNIH